MNRREFVKMLGGLGLWGLAAWLPKLRGVAALGESEGGSVLTIEKLDAAIQEVDAVLQELDAAETEWLEPHLDHDVGMVIGVGTVIFVDVASGDDANDGLSFGTPVRSWEKAWSLASAPRDGWIYTIHQDGNGGEHSELQMM